MHVQLTYCTVVKTQLSYLQGKQYLKTTTTTTGTDLHQRETHQPYSRTTLEEVKGDTSVTE